MDDGDDIDRAWKHLRGTDAAAEEHRVRNGAPWCVTAVEGLQYYLWREDDGMGGIHDPQPGDRLQLVREPDNENDPNAIRVEWRNGIMLGHIDRNLASTVAPALDDGLPLRAYVLTTRTSRRSIRRGLNAVLTGQAVTEKQRHHWREETPEERQAEQKREQAEQEWEREEQARQDAELQEEEDWHESQMQMTGTEAGASISFWTAYDSDDLPF